MEGKKFLYGGLSEKIISLVYKIYHELGYGHPEKVYQESLAIELKKAKIDFKRECYAKILYDGEIVGKYFLDYPLTTASGGDYAKGYTSDSIKIAPA